MLILKEYKPHSCRSSSYHESKSYECRQCKIFKMRLLKNIKAFFNFDKNDIIYYSPEDKYRLYEYFNIK